MIITNPEGFTLTNTIWFENNKMRSEMATEGQTIITLTNFTTRTVYIYYPDQNMAMRADYEPTETALDETDGIEQYNPEILGTEMLDGKECLVIRYNIEGATTKMWIWKEYGFAIRIEVNDQNGLTTIQYKNISFSDIDDSLFELPAGVEILDIPGV
jgi:outer membrane lipoprotein-sorting protein